jgi:putative transposase
MADHVHMMLSVPPKYAVSKVVGYIKGKSAIHLAWVYGERKRNFTGQSFWARGHFVSTVGRDEEVIRTTSATKSKKTSDSNSSVCGDKWPP